MKELEKAARMALEALQYLVEHDSYGTEYDGRIIHICPSCSKQDGAHSQNCDFVKGRQVITALTQALDTTAPGFDGSVIVGHSKHRGGWFVFEEFAEGEFTPIKGPFSSRDEADQAMRDPHAPLIQPATPEPDVPETNFGNTTERNLTPTPASPADMQVYNKIAAGYWTERKADPVAKFDEMKGRPVLLPDSPMLKHGDLLYTSPQVPEDVQRDAERYRWLRAKENANRDEWNLFGPYSTPAQIDAAIDAARKGE